MWEKAVKNVKGLAFSLIFFLIMTIIFSLLIKFGPLPERWSGIYVLIGLCLASIFYGLYMGYYLKKKGFFYGMGYAILLLLIVVGFCTIIFQNSVEISGFYLRYLLCVLCGGIGGIIGVNLRS